MLKVGDIIKVVRETCYVPPSDHLLVVTSVNSTNDFWNEPGDAIRAKYLVKHTDNSYGDHYVGNHARPVGLILQPSRVQKI